MSLLREQGDEVIRLDYGQRVLMDVLDVARRPDSYAVMLLDMSGAEAFRREYRKRHGVALTNLHLIIKAVARLIREEPWINYMVDGYKLIKPSTIDVGVSVAGEEGITPVVVIQEADKKSLQQISEELKTKAAEAVEQERENLKRLNRWGRWLPFDFLRRRVIRYLANQYRVRRTVIGTVQITSVGLKDLAFHLPSHMGTTWLLSVGGVVRRPVVVGDHVEIRPTVYVACQVDTRVVNAVRGVKAFRRFRRLVEHPEELDGPSE